MGCLQSSMFQILFYFSPLPLGGWPWPWWPCYSVAWWLPLFPLICVSPWTICIRVCVSTSFVFSVRFHKLCCQGECFSKCCCQCVFVCLVISGPFLPALSSVFVLAASSVFTSSVVGVCFHLFCISVCFRKFCCLYVSTSPVFSGCFHQFCFHIGCQCFHKSVCKFPMVPSPAFVFLKLFFVSVCFRKFCHQCVRFVVSVRFHMKFSNIDF